MSISDGMTQTFKLFISVCLNNKKNVCVEIHSGSILLAALTTNVQISRQKKNYMALQLLVNFKDRFSIVFAKTLFFFSLCLHFQNKAFVCIVFVVANMFHCAILSMVNVTNFLANREFVFRYLKFWVFCCCCVAVVFIHLCFSIFHRHCYILFSTFLPLIVAPEDFTAKTKE